MGALVHYYTEVLFMVVAACLCGASLAEKSRGLEIQCGEVDVKITVKRQFFEEKQVPFTPERLRLGVNSPREMSCQPNRQLSDRDTMVISAGLRECGSESSVGEGERGATETSAVKLRVCYED